VFAIFVLNEQPSKILKSNVTADNWINVYRELRSNSHGVNMIYFSALMLSLGFSNKIGGCYRIVRECFHDVFSYAASAKVSDGIWGVIPKDLDVGDEEEISIIQAFIGFLGLGLPKKKYQVESWDYCEQLIRTLVNTFIRYEWPTQAFLDTLNNGLTFKRAVQYCISFKRGRRFLFKITNEYKQGNIKPLSHQKEMLEKYEF
jgi:hypothetical protein